MQTIDDGECHKYVNNSAAGSVNTGMDTNTPDRTRAHEWPRAPRPGVAGFDR